MTLVEQVAVSTETWLRRFWYPACASSRLRRAPLATRVLDNNLVVFRGPQGNPAALENRCCHQGVELSLGRVKSGTIACRYHGWRYDSSGRCIEIPSLTDGRIPVACRVRHFECVERDGYVWVWVGDTLPESPPAPIDDFRSRRWVQGSMPMHCTWLAGVENNLDWCHPAFAHRWTHPQFYAKLFRGNVETAYEMRIDDTGRLVVFYPPTASEDEQIPEGSAVKLTFQLPNLVRVEIGRSRRTIILQFVPTGEDTCRLEWMRGSSMGRGVRWSPSKGLINEQDRKILESAQRATAGRRISVKADASTLLARQMVDIAIAGRSPEQTGALPRRRVVAVRL
jgi:phenylpropionate dioxygenase-like ring-hydroxylating dioxygenase large terminal subunit